MKQLDSELQQRWIILPSPQLTPARRTASLHTKWNYGVHCIFGTSEAEKDLVYIMNLNTIGSLIWVFPFTKIIYRQVINMKIVLEILANPLVLMHSLMTSQETAQA